MVVEGFRFFVGEVMTGKIVADLPATDPKWGLRLNDAGTVSVSIPAYSREAQAMDLRGLTRPVKMFLGASYGDQVLECGPIWTRAFNAKTGELALDAAGIWSILDRRKVLPGSALAVGAFPTKLAVKISDKTLGTIARELVRVSLQDNPHPGGALKIVLPAAVNGTHDRTYHGYDLGWVGERLRQLTGVERGPDIRFQPRFKGGDPNLVEWVMQVGTEAQPALVQSGLDWVWDATPQDSGVTGLSVTEDASELAARAWVPGSGQDVKMKLAYATDTTLVKDGYPWTEVDTASKDTEDQAILQAYANRLMSDSGQPWETWKLEVRADQDPLLGLYLPGDWATVHVPKGHPIADSGTRRVRILSVDGGGDNSVSLGLAPIPGMPDSTRGASITTTRPSTTLIYPGTDLYPSETLYPLGDEHDITYLE